jgi:signal transduction histidine kinase
MTDELPLEMVNLNVGLLKSNNHLLDMVNKMLETYQYEAGKIRLVPESVNLSHLVAECLEGVQGWAQQKNVTLKNLIPADLPPGHWDYDQMRRVFQNLIGNALENIQDDRQVEVAVVPTDLENLIRVEVRDNGPGIHPDILPLLFTRYFTGDRRRQKIGSGLGLYICSMIIALHGGSIHVESTLGEGTTFVIHLPGRIPANPNSTERKLV